MNDREMKKYAKILFERWTFLNSVPCDNGMLLLAAVGQKKFYLHRGSGAREAVSFFAAHRMISLLERGDYSSSEQTYQHLKNFVLQLKLQLRKYESERAPTSTKSSKGIPVLIWVLIFIAIYFIALGILCVCSRWVKERREAAERNARLDRLPEPLEPIEISDRESECLLKLAKIGEIRAAETLEIGRQLALKSCPKCLDDVDNVPRVTKLQCGHTFCFVCMSSVQRCPVCTADVPEGGNREVWVRLQFMHKHYPKFVDAGIATRWDRIRGWRS
eukprot:263868_1